MEDSTNPKEYTCAVCGKKFTDTWNHVLIPDPTFKGMLVPKDKPHAERIKELENGVEMKKNRCFCGGTVVTNGHGEDSWDTSCIECDMLYDED